VSQLLADCVCVCEGIGRCFLALIPTTLSPNDQQFLYLFALLLHLPLFMRSLSSVHLPCSFSYVVCLSPHTHTHTHTHNSTHSPIPHYVVSFCWEQCGSEFNLLYLRCFCRFSAAGWSPGQVSRGTRKGKQPSEIAASTNFISFPAN